MIHVTNNMVWRYDDRIHSIICFPWITFVSTGEYYFEQIIIDSCHKQYGLKIWWWNPQYYLFSMNHIWLYRIILFWSNDYRCSINILLWTFDDRVHRIICFQWITFGYYFDQMIIDVTEIYHFEHMMMESTVLSTFIESCWVFQEYTVLIKWW